MYGLSNKLRLVLSNRREPGRRDELLDGGRHE